jgi:hypothetical protein
MELSFYGFGADAPKSTLHHGIITHRTMVLTPESYRSWVTGKRGSVTLQTNANQANTIT